MGVFADWQPIYAEHGIPTFPVVGKRPQVTGFLRIGPKLSSKLVERFPDSGSLGFALGKRAMITVLDVDSNDEKVLAEALAQFGPTPVVARTGSGHFQAWYRYRGERRLIRPQKDAPIDILGGGFVVAPPSRGERFSYAFIQGGLGDLTSLPHLVSSALITDCAPQAQHIAPGTRNLSLFEACMRFSKEGFISGGLSESAVLRFAEQFNSETLKPSLPRSEVLKTAKSALSYTRQGRNRFLEHGAWLPEWVGEQLAKDPYLCALVIFLQSKNGPYSLFWIADGLASELGWSRREFAGARFRALQTEWVERVRPPGRGRPALFRWGKTYRNR